MESFVDKALTNRLVRGCYGDSESGVTVPSETDNSQPDDGHCSYNVNQTPKKSDTVTPATQSKFKWAKTNEERNKLWKARHEVYYSVKALKPNTRIYTTDACVPISRLAECIRYAEKEINKYGLRAPIVGHVGDGNFHVTVVYDPEKKEDHKMIREFSNNLIKKTLELDGTITGEHGIGINKKEYLIMQHKDNIPVMRMIKNSIDPKNIMNPGKNFDLK